MITICQWSTDDYETTGAGAGTERVGETRRQGQGASKWWPKTQNLIYSLDVESIVPVFNRLEKLLSQLLTACVRWQVDFMRAGMHVREVVRVRFIEYLEWN